jgi:anti-sigma factor RsiW
MPTEACETIRDQIVDYADGELDPASSGLVGDHLKQCPACQQQIEALRRSLVLAQQTWTEADRRLDGVSTPTTRRSTFLRKLPRRLSIAVAAAVVLVLVRPLWQSPPSVGPFTNAPAKSLARIEQEIWQAGAAAEMLAAADVLARAPGGEPYAHDSLRLIAKRYPNTRAAGEAEDRLRVAVQRSIP